jgi:hypothetical protein
MGFKELLEESEEEERNFDKQIVESYLPLSWYYKNWIDFWDSNKYNLRIFTVNN